MIDGTPELHHLTVYADVHFVLVPLPMAKTAHPIYPLAANVGREHRTEPVPPQPDRLMANVDAAFRQEVFHVPQRKRKSDIYHHDQSDDFRRRMEIPERVGWFLGSGHQPPLPGTAAFARCTILLAVHLQGLQPRDRGLAKATATYRFIVDVDAVFRQRILDFAQRQRKTHMGHYHQADDSRRSRYNSLDSTLDPNCRAPKIAPTMEPHKAAGSQVFVFRLRRANCRAGIITLMLGIPLRRSTPPSWLIAPCNRHSLMQRSCQATVPGIITPR
nr:hypothetical protein [Croceicoccus hydrothermalis]